MARSSPAKGTRSVLLLMVPFIAIVVLMTATRGLDVGEDIGVSEAREQWADAGGGDHRVTYHLNGFGPATVTFVDGVVADYTTTDPHLEDATLYWVDALFDAIDLVEDDLGGDVTAVTFDDELGYPTSAAVDPDRTVRGDEWTIVVDGVELLGGSR